MEISIVVYSFLICAYFFRMQLGCKPRAGFFIYIYIYRVSHSLMNPALL